MKCIFRSVEPPRRPQDLILFYVHHVLAVDSDLRQKKRSLLAKFLSPLSQHSILKTAGTPGQCASKRENNQNRFELPAFKNCPESSCSFSVNSFFNLMGT